ncbi:DUF402 domain-containing protein [Arthrobacter sp. KK5.5]|uniref:DUF402 domain-containing protein n=1 Tax=Arthrobacter sp. KK5.5 TaxID=3373084 RepID=UPI003EE6E3EE
MSLPRDLVRTPPAIEAGAPIVARAWKYDGGAHWVVPGTYLGADSFGHWVFQPRGSFVSRPGLGFMAESDAVCLFPHAGDWVATFYDESHPGDVRLYIDVSTGIGWRPLRPAGWEVNSIDMDLDVIRSNERGVFLDDEDEFAEHAVAFGYPEVLRGAMGAEAEFLLGSVRNRTAPFDSTAGAWLAAGRSAAGAASDPH